MHHDVKRNLGRQYGGGICRRRGLVIDNGLMA